MSSKLVFRDEEESDSGGISVGWLLAIALAGGALLFVSIAFILVTLTDRRNQKARIAAEVETSHQQPSDVEKGSGSGGGNGSCNDDDTNSSSHRKQHRRRLTKSPQVSPAKRRRSLPHMVPRMKRNNSAISRIFRSPVKQRQQQSFQRQLSARRTNSWVDEDAIHGPKISKTERESKRFSIRDNWPFILRSPTLPTLLGYRDDTETSPFYSHQNYPLISMPRPVVLAPEKQQEKSEPRPVSRVPLVRSPSYELAQQRAAAMFQSTSQHEEEEQEHVEQEQPQPQKHHDTAKTTQSPGPQGPRPAPLKRFRTFNTETDLQTILNQTERRLRDGSPSPTKEPKRTKNPHGYGNLPTRHRRTPASHGTPIRGFRNDNGNGDTYRGVQKTPVSLKAAQPSTPQSAPAAMYQKRQQVTETGSPQKASRELPSAGPSPSTPHRRDMSESSVASEVDSLYGESTPEAEPTPSGLSSPSRRCSDGSASIPIEPQQKRSRSMSVPSMTSSVSSCLSTVYSEEEADEDGTKSINQTLHSATTTASEGLPKIEDRAPKQPRHVPSMSDPFVVPGSVPKLPEKSPRRSMTIAGTSHRPQRSSRSSIENPLGQVSGNAHQVNSSPIMSALLLEKASQASARDPSRQSMTMTVPDLDSQYDDMRPKSVASMKPTIFNSSTSVVSMTASPSTPEEERKSSVQRPKTSHGRRSLIMPPPTSLHPIEASPRVKDAENDPWARAEHAQEEIELPTTNRRIRRSSLARSDSVDDIISLPSSPPPNRPLPDPTQIPASPTPTRIKRRRSTVGAISNPPARTNSVLSSTSSVYSDAVEELHASPARPSSRRSQTPSPTKPNFQTPQVVVRSAASPQRVGHPADVSPLTASIMQLRRMNSQMSIASSAEGTNPPVSPTIPEFRGGGFSPAQRSSLMGKAGSHNYLNMGSPSGSTGSPSPGAKQQKQQRGRGIKHARDSVLPSPSRSGSALRNAMEEGQQVKKERSKSQSQGQGQGQRVVDMGGEKSSSKKKKKKTQGGIKEKDQEINAKRSPSKGGLKTSSSLRGADSPKRRLSVRFADVEEHVFVDDENEQEIFSDEAHMMVDSLSTPPKSRGVMSPSQNHNRGASVNLNRMSAESLGLYDKDGFLMSSPDRLPSAAAEGGRGSGLRV